MLKTISLLLLLLIVSGPTTYTQQGREMAKEKLPTSVLSPVIGPLRVTTSNQAIRDGLWEFNQHKKVYHNPVGGIALSNDRFAWDVNLYTPTNENEDADKPVFAVAEGQVVKYVDSRLGGGFGAVLIAHPNAQSPVWFSGYIHLRRVRVSLNQQVNVATVLGDIGRAGTTSEHLHFVVYSGQNSRGNLQSFNVAITERSAATMIVPAKPSDDPGSALN